MDEKPIRIIAWQCPFCNELGISYWQMEDHMHACLYNPTYHDDDEEPINEVQDD